jgi:hypothetical protein
MNGKDCGSDPSTGDLKSPREPVNKDRVCCVKDNIQQMKYPRRTASAKPVKQPKHRIRHRPIMFFEGITSGAKPNAPQSSKGG